MLPPSRSALASPTRLAAVRATGLVGAPADPVLERIARSAAALLGVPTSFVTMIEEARQCIVALGTELPDGDDARFLEIPIGWSLCRHALETGEAFVVDDARADAELGALPPVASGVVRAYLGVPVRAGGEIVGTLCATSDAPRAWTPEEVARLRDLAAIAEDVLGHRREVGERLAAEQAARESEARLEFALAAAGMGTWDWDALADRVTCSDGVGPIFGLPVGRCHDSHDAFLAAIHPGDRAAVAEAIGRSVRDAAPYGLRLRIVHPDGAVRWVAQHGRIFHDVAGRPVRMAGVVRDVTALHVAEQRRAEAEAALVAGEHRFRALVERTSELIALVDASGTITYASPGYQRVFGWTIAELEGASVFERIHPDDVAGARAALAAVQGSAGAERALRLRCRHEDGSWRTLDVAAENRLDDPAIGRVVVNARDVTERDRLETQLRQAQKMEAVGQLAGGIAHDFNNMLTVIAAHARFLRDQLPPGGEAHEDLDHLEEAVRRAGALTRQLLVFSRRQPVARRPVALDALVEGLERMLARTLGEDVEIVARYGAGDATVLGDPGQLEQVVLNLVVNARDAMPGGGVLVIETRRAGPPHDRRVCLTVSDTGCGMAAATQARIFEPFFTTKPPGRGTGLGLATVYAIVAAAGGEIRVRSRLGRGTRFEIELPAHHADEPPPDAAPVAGAAPPGRGETVLLVEDEGALRAVVARMLRQQGYAVVEAAHGGEALACWRALDGPGGAVPLVLSDVTMPVMGGRELAAALLAEHPGQRLLLMTGYTDRPIPEVVVAHGVEVLAKPFDALQLARLVRATLDRAVGTPAAPAGR